MRLNKYITKNEPLLTEKVSKKDILSILKSSDIIIGAEFEFFPNFLREAFKKNENVWLYYDKGIYSAYTDYDDERNEWILHGREDDPPKIPKEVIYYDERFCQNINKYSKYKDGEEIPMPLEPGEVIGYYDIDDSDQWDECVIKNIPKLSPPFGSNYEVESYEMEINRSGWVIEPDGSLGSQGIEIITPPLPLGEFIKICPKIFKWINSIGTTSRKCGFHIHMSLKNIPDLTKSLDLVKLTMFTDEEYIYKFFPERIDNDYAQSMKKKLLKKGINENDWKDFIDVKKLKNKVGSEHWNSINWEGLEDDKQHIEFRYMGGAQYHSKWDNIKIIIAQYAYNLNLACNPDSHIKEYSRKIQRILNKIEMSKYYNILKQIEDVVIKKYPKEIKMDVERLYKYYKEKYMSYTSLYKMNKKYMADLYDIDDELHDISDELRQAYIDSGGKKYKTITFFNKFILGE